MSRIDLNILQGKVEERVEERRGGHRHTPEEQVREKGGGKQTGREQQHQP